MWEIDYHVHTTCSDGILTPEGAVRFAADNKLKAIAITDHDGVSALLEAMKAGGEYGVKVVAGVEIATVYDKDTLHVLGYNFDIDDENLNIMMKRISKRRDERNEKLVAILQEMGCDITREQLLKGRSSNFVGKPVIARLLEKKGYVQSWRDAFRNDSYLGSSQARAIKKFKPDAGKIVKLICDAGGIAVLAHPIQIRRQEETDEEAFYARLERVVRSLKECGLYGLECYHPDQDRETTLRMLDIACRYGLKVSRGTDLHEDDYGRSRPTCEYIEEGNCQGYGIYPDDFIQV